MKIDIRKIITVSASVVLAVSYLLAPSAKAAGTATLSVSPSTGAYVVGNVISVGIYEDSGTDSVNSVQANLTYSSSLLSCSNSSITSSNAYNLSLQNTCGGGSVQIARAASPAVTGSQLVATVSFTATAAGNASISFASGSGVARSTDHGSETLTTIGSSYTIAAPAPPSGGSGSSSGSSGGSTGGSSSPSGSTSSSKNSGSSSTSSSTGSKSSPATAANPAFTITAIAVTNLSDKTATITWKTSVPTTSEVDYGTSTSYLASAVDSTLTTNHYVVLDPSNLLASTTFHFVVKSADASHHLITSPDQSFKTLAAAPAAKKSWNLTSWLAAGSVFVLLLGSLILLLVNLLRGRHHHGGISAGGPFNTGGGSGHIIAPLSGGGPTNISPISGAMTTDQVTDSVLDEQPEPSTDTPGPDISI